MSIKLIGNPEFTVAIPARAASLDLPGEGQSALGLTSKVATFAINFFSELPKATISTFSASPRLFK